MGVPDPLGVKAPTVWLCSVRMCFACIYPSVSGPVGMIPLRPAFGSVVFRSFVNSSVSSVCQPNALASANELALPHCSKTVHLTFYWTTAAYLGSGLPTQCPSQLQCDLHARLLAQLCTSLHAPNC